MHINLLTASHTEHLVHQSQEPDLDLYAFSLENITNICDVQCQRLTYLTLSLIRHR